MNYLGQLEPNILLKYKKGLTLIELLLVVSITIILAAASTPFISRFVLVNSHDTVVSQIKSVLAKAQSYAIQGKNNEIWGVCLQNNILTLFSNDCATPTYSEE